MLPPRPTPVSYTHLDVYKRQVVDILRLNLEERNIPVYLQNKVLSIEKNKKNLFKIKTNEGEYSCRMLLLCTGGKSYPKLGSDGSGYKLASSLKHTIIPTTPGIVQLKLDYNRLKAISGVKFTSTCSVLVNDKVEKDEFGEILFTDYGISGPPILQLSRVASRAILDRKDVSVCVNIRCV